MITGTSTARTTAATICSWICGAGTRTRNPIPRHQRLDGAQLGPRESGRSHWGREPGHHLHRRAMPGIHQPSLVSAMPRSLLEHWLYSSLWWERLPAAEHAPNHAAPKLLHWSFKHRHNRRAVSHLLHGVPAAPRSCGPDTANSRSGREPAAGTSSTSKEKYSVPAARGGGCARNVAVKCIS